MRLLLTSGEACEALRVVPETLRAMLRRGQLEGFRGNVARPPEGPTPPGVG